MKKKRPSRIDLIGQNGPTGEHYTKPKRLARVCCDGGGPTGLHCNHDHCTGSEHPSIVKEKDSE